MDAHMFLDRPAPPAQHNCLIAAITPIDRPDLDFTVAEAHLRPRLLAPAARGHLSMVKPSLET
jgi:hypothetical protein